MKIVIGSDHAGFHLKKHIYQWLVERHYEVEDCGVHNLDSVDYPDIAYEVATKVGDGTYEKAILVCGSGIGIGIAANKVPGVRAALCYDMLTARLSRQHNDSNIITLGERLTTPTQAEEILNVWLATEFEGGRHQRRVDKLNNYGQETAITP